MSKIRRVTILEGMFLDICSPDEKRKIDELYNKGFKASAVVFMLKRIRNKWIELINHKCNSESSLSSNNKDTQNTNNNAARTVKINGYGVSQSQSW